MSKGRAVPVESAAAERRRMETEERYAVMLSLDPALFRVWALRWLPPDRNTVALADDASLIASMHEARMRDEAIPPLARLLSTRWLAAHGDTVAMGIIAALPDDKAAP